LTNDYRPQTPGFHPNFCSISHNPLLPYFHRVKNIALIVFLLIAGLLHAQRDTLVFGKDDGQPNSKNIGPEGGKIISADGGVELIFPAGALEKATLITIQPTVNLAYNASGKSYRFEPSGIQFKKAVGLIFHYTDEENAVCPADAMGLASQDDNGKWKYFDYDDVDTIAKTITGSIHHFSGYSKMNKIMIRPGKELIGVDTKTYIEVVDTSLIEKDGEFAGDFQYARVRASDVIECSVNGKKDGDKYFGKINSSLYSLPGRSKDTNWVTIDYFAPHYMPAQNPVIIEVVIRYPSKKARGPVKGRFRCQIELYDVYRFKVAATTELRLGMGNVIIDSGTFLLRVYRNRSQIENIDNGPVKFLKHGDRLAGCKLNLITQDAPGIVHITNSLSNYLWKRDNDLAPLDISFSLKTLDVLVCKFQWICRGIVTPAQSLVGTTEPAIFSFYANGDMQEYTIGKSNFDTKIIITPYRVW